MPDFKCKINLEFPVDAENITEARKALAEYIEFNFERIADEAKITPYKKRR